MSDPNFKSFAAAFADDLSALSLMNFAMKYESVCEGFYDGSLGFAEGEREIFSLIGRAVAAIYDEDADAAGITDELLAKREELIGKMEALTSFTDYFRIHEYILNRIELRFSSEDIETDNDEEARRLLSFIFEPEDNAEVNLRIKEMIAQLPVRMTASRFFDLLSESLTIYKGYEKEGLDSHIYMIRSAAGLIVDDKTELYPKYAEYVKRFDEIDYKDIDEAVYNEYADLLRQVSDELTYDTEFVMACMELLNDISAYFIASSYVSAVPSVAETVRAEILMVKDIFEAESDGEGFIEPDPEIAGECFIKLEGRPEKLINKISAAEGRLEGFKELDAGEQSISDALKDADKLLSSSVFVSLRDGLDTTIVDAQILAEVYAGLEAELKSLFEGRPKLVRRAVMAQILKELPVFFVSHTEVMNYIRFTLDNCGDNAEKTASLRLFWQIYEEK